MLKLSRTPWLYFRVLLIQTGQCVENWRRCLAVSVCAPRIAIACIQQQQQQQQQRLKLGFTTYRAYTRGDRRCNGSERSSRRSPRVYTTFDRRGDNRQSVARLNRCSSRRRSPRQSRRRSPHVYALLIAGVVLLKTITGPTVIVIIVVRNSLHDYTVTEK